MLIFQPHPPYIITNGWQPLHDLSHSTIIFQRAQSPYQHVTLKTPPPALLLQTLLSMMVASEIYFHWTS